MAIPILTLAVVAMIAWLLMVVLLAARLSWIYDRNPKLVGRPRFFTRIDSMTGKPRLGITPEDGFHSLGFLYSGRHKDFADPVLSALVWMVRVLLLVGLGMMATNFVSILSARSAAQ